MPLHITDMYISFCMLDIIGNTNELHGSHYVEAGKKTDGTSREKQTKIIDAYIGRGSSGKFIVRDDHPYIKEVVMHTEAKYHNEGMGGAYCQTSLYTCTHHCTHAHMHTLCLDTCI